MTTQLVTIEAGTELAALSTKKGIDSLLNRAKDAVKNSDGGNLKTKVGRAKIRSNAFQATKLKTSMEKEAVKLINVIEKNIAPELEKIVNIKKYSKELGLGLDKIRSDTNIEVKAVEDELQAIEDEKQLKLKAEMLAKEKDNDHEVGLLMDEKFDREITDAKIKFEAKAKIEAARLVQEKIDNDARIAREAAKEATAKAERLAQQKIDDAITAKQQAIDDKAQANRELLASQAKQELLEEQAKQEKLNNEWLAYISEAYDHNASIDRDRQTKFLAAQAETRRLADIETSKQNEIFRQQEEKRLIDEATAIREADKKHRGNINRAILKVLLDNGISEKDAKTMVKLAAKRELPHLVINY